MAVTLTRQTVLIFFCSSLLNIRGGWPLLLTSDLGTPEERHV
jgi:hypothetical protein